MQFIDEKKKKRPYHPHRRHVVLLLLLVTALFAGIGVYTLNMLMKPHLLLLTTAGENTYLVEMDGTLYRDTGLFCRNMVWSPDGQHFLCRTADQNLILQPDSTDVVVIDDYKNTSLSDIPWLPDSQAIIYFQRDKQAFQTISVDGRVTTIVPDSTFDGEWLTPFVSGSGQVAFLAGEKDDVTWDSYLYMMNADGTNLHHSDDMLSAAELSWSPDESRLVYANYQSMNGIDTYRSLIGIIDYNRPNQPSGFTSKNGIFPLWSPDGHTLLYTSDATIYVYNLDTSIITYSTEGHSPVWPGSSSKIGFVREGQVYFVDIDTREVWQPFTTNYDVTALAWQP